MSSNINPAELTPVRIRGKKRATSAQSKSKVSRTTASGMSRAKQTLKALKAENRHLSSLELLPKEILEIIFTFTVNPNFPRASHIIARKLSGQKILDWHCRRIFRTFEYELHTHNPLRQVEPHRYVVLDGRVQENWHDLIKARTATLQHSSLTCDYFIDLCQSLLDEEKQRLAQQFDLNSAQPDVGWSQYDNLQIGHINPLLHVKAQPQLEQVLRTLRISLDFTCNIPASLLRYPLSADSRSLLDFLVSAGAQIDWQNSFDEERALEAWNKAVRAMDYRLVHRFMGPGINVRLSEEDLEKALQDINWDAAMFKLVAISFNTSRAFYSNTTVPRRLPWPLEGYGDFEDLRNFRFKASFDSKYPSVWTKTRARNGPASPGRALLEDHSNISLLETWGGAMCSAGILRDWPRLCYCYSTTGKPPSIGAWHVLNEVHNCGEANVFT